ncbi:DUF6445 family protein [Saccharophagus sp. K07]|jgi:hypothetical protein|uniref:DUF6445 family protein n=1 Tax=Saccharophagus sp. K07 TaxID=2283636 RepID=UPI001CA300D6|nr:DUF6445 family protein [Saccharophagus sp. K07]
MNCSFKTIGNEHQPLMVIDDFHPLPADLVEAARHQKFIQDKTSYPGVRAPAPQGYAEHLALTVNKMVLPSFGLHNRTVRFLFSTYACVTRSPEELHILQRIPHFDSNEPEQLACIHYLSRPELNCGGTAFYRHVKTGFEYVDSLRVETYSEVLERQIQNGEVPDPPQYICDNSNLFTQIHTEEAGYNRLVIYRSTSLHSGLITNEYKHQGHPADGRLTITSFMKLSPVQP